MRSLPPVGKCIGHSGADAYLLGAKALGEVQAPLWLMNLRANARLA